VKKKRFTVKQIAGILKQAQMGAAIAEWRRQHGIPEQNYYRWKKIYGGMQRSDARVLRQLREENVNLKRLVAHLSLDKVVSVIRHHQTSLERLRDAISSNAR
jgi:putative transposase